MFTISMPATIALIAYCVLILIILLPFKVPIEDVSGNITVLKYNIGERLLVMILMLLPIILSVYSINCMVVGDCHLLSLFIALLTAIWVASITVLSFYATFSRATA